MSKYIFLVSGTMFENRKEAKLTLGQSRFRRLMKKGLVRYIEEEEKED